MEIRKVGQWVCTLAIAWGSASAVVSCGSSGDSSIFNGGGQQDSSTISNDDSSVTTDDGPSFVTDDGGGDGNGGCVPKSCKDLGFDCGPQGDGCGNVIDCGKCTLPQFCGGGGPSKCGGNTTVGPDGSTICTPLTACPTGQNCGFAGDGCGGVINCAGDGGGCVSPEFCGGGGFNKCGGSNGLQPDGAIPCNPLTACTGGQNCGVEGDGCGGQITCGTGTCVSPQYCGGGGFNICGGNNGLAPDGAPNCTPTTCLKLGFNCGPAGDGCGGLLQCGTCTGTGNICGGGGQPGVCGNSTCVGLCKQQPTCGGGIVTTITGRVVAGTLPLYGSPDPVPNVVVYVPNAPLQPFKPGVSCSQCGAEVTGSPLVQTTTAFDGTFTLPNMPAGNGIPVVIQLGRWRRTVFFNVTACATPAQNVGDIRMPRNQGEGDIPLTAISAGSVDAIECVLLKMGVDQGEFTNPAGGGRMQMYTGGGGSGASPPGGTTNEATLMANGGSFMSYDQILFPCWGSRKIKTNAELANLVTYANGGGHFFATHFSYSWLFQNNPFNTTAQWNADHSSDNGPDPFTVQLPPTNPKGTVFSKWLHLVGAMPNPQTVQINFPRHDVNKVLLQSVDWIDGADPKDGSQMLAHYTFDTPVGSANQCGHVIYSDFHVSNVGTDPNTVFPTECDTNPMTAQEKILEYMIWDLASCVPGPPTPPTCTPITCQSQNISCGPAGDGCGNQLNCGVCTPPQTCGGGGVPGQCGAPDGGSCAPLTCQAQNINCGPAGDGCGNALQCGTCAPPLVCGGGGTPGQCGAPDAGACTPQTCSQQNIFCGPAGDGCGNQIQCGTCTPPQTCGGGGTPGQCGIPDGGNCSPISCAAQHLNCGPASDGCGNLLQCGTCVPPQSCGGSGTPGQCGGIQ